MTALYLRLAAPLQSWASTRTTGNFVFTERQPTRTGLIGLLAAALGAPRGEWPGWLADVDLAARTDKPGTVADDFQTINPRDEDLRYQKRMYRILSGKRWSSKTIFTPDGQHSTSIVRRTYLSDAEFLVRVRAGEHHDEVFRAVRRPVFSPYLGRRAFAPVMPFLLGEGDDAEITRIPCAAEPASRGRDQAVGGGERAVTLRIDYLPPDNGDGSWSTLTVPSVNRAQWLEDLRLRLRR